MSDHASTPLLDLATRTRVPDDIAFLRAAYPEPGWRGHANYGELSAFWLQIHDSLRAQGAGVIETIAALRERRTDALGFQRAFVPRLNQFLQSLDHHHGIEDAAYFPRFRALDPRMVRGFDLLETDHEAIHARLTATLTSARALLAALARGDARPALDAHAGDATDLLRLLDRHLGDEEELVIPALLRHGERAVR